MNKLLNIKGHKFHVAGSASENADKNTLLKTHIFVKGFIKKILSLGGGLTITAKEEPLLKNKIPLIFDWTIIQAIVEFLEMNSINWPIKNQKPITIITYYDFKSKIPKKREKLWEKLLSYEDVGFKKELSKKNSVGDELRKEQAKDGDILITLGGKKGVYRLATLYQKERKSIIPLDIDLGINNSSHDLADEAKNQPGSFFICKNPERICALFCNLPVRTSNFEIKLIDNLLLLIDTLFSLQIHQNSKYREIIIQELIQALVKLQEKQNILRKSEN
ncbi:MAG: hypothetical protein ACTSVV_11015, partial [Promethearchaeota archaeon]